MLSLLVIVMMSMPRRMPSRAATKPTTSAGGMNPEKTVTVDRLGSNLSSSEAASSIYDTDSSESCSIASFTTFRPASS